MYTNLGLSLVVLGMHLIAARGQTRPAPKPPDPQGGPRLLAEGDRLADRGEYHQALLRYKAAYEKILPDLRGLAFRKPVSPAFMERKNLRAHMEMIHKEETSDQESALSDATLKAFGFVNSDFRSEKTALDLQAEEVAGFYDPKRKQIFLIRETVKSEQPSLLTRLFGTQPGFDKDEQKMVLAHELAHALADQHFDLQKMDADAEDDDDRYLALEALVEGEATVVMEAEMMRRIDGTGELVLRLSPGAVDFGNLMFRGFVPFMSGATFKSAPPIIQETMLFGYLKGMVFVLNLTNAGGWERVNRAFRRPPLSTEQILHPEKYLKNSDPPTETVLPDLTKLVGADWKELGQNVLGEFQISVLLREHWGYVAAPGWDGDRYAVFIGPEEKLALVWFTTWDSEQDAMEFAGAYGRYVDHKLRRPGVASVAASGAFPPTIPDLYRLEHEGRSYEVVRRGSDVVVIEGFSEKTTDSLTSAVLMTKKRPKT